MAFKMGEVPTGKLVLMYLSDDGDLYSLGYRDQQQVYDVSTIIAPLLGGIMGRPLVITDDPLNEAALEWVSIEDKIVLKKN